MNAFKQAWLAEQMLDYAQKRGVAKEASKVAKRRGKELSVDLTRIAAEQKAQATVLKGAHVAFKYAAKSQMKGSLGMA